MLHIPVDCVGIVISFISDCNLFFVVYSRISKSIKYHVEKEDFKCCEKLRFTLVYMPHEIKPFVKILDCRNCSSWLLNSDVEKIPKYFPNLLSIDLFNCNKISKESCNYLVGLEHVNIGNTVLSDVSIQILGKSKKLRFLEVNGNRITNAVSKHISHVEFLNISFCKSITDEFLKDLTNISNLNAKKCKITNKGLDYLGENQKNFGFKLKKLNVSRNREIDGDGIVHFKFLTHLNLSNCQKIDSENVILLLSRLNNLIDLDLSHTKTDDDALLCLANIKRLDLSHCPITNGEDLVSLKCKVLWIKGIRGIAQQVRKLEKKREISVFWGIF